MVGTCDVVREWKNQERRQLVRLDENAGELHRTEADVSVRQAAEEIYEAVRDGVRGLGLIPRGGILG